MTKEVLIFMLIAQIIVQCGIWFTFKGIIFAICQLLTENLDIDSDKALNAFKILLFCINLGISIAIIKFTRSGAAAGASNFIASGFLYMLMQYDCWKFKRYLKYRAAANK